MPRGIYPRKRRGQRRRIVQSARQQAAQKRDFRTVQTAQQAAAQSLLEATSAELRLGRTLPMTVVRRLSAPIDY